MKKRIIASLCVALAAQIGSASATVVTVGRLSSDTATKVTTDTDTGRNYTRFDAFNLTYAQTQAAIADGGAWAGWSFATSSVSDDFIAAALNLGTTPCSGAVTNGTQCGTIADWTDGKLGASYSSAYDYYAYVAGPSTAGLVEIRSAGLVRDFQSWSSLTQADFYKGSTPINYLLYREASAVPEPASLVLLGLGLAGLAGARRRAR